MIRLPKVAASNICFISDEVVFSDGWNSGESNAVILSDRVVDSKACFSVSDGELDNRKLTQSAIAVLYFSDVSRRQVLLY